MGVELQEKHQRQSDFKKQDASQNLLLHRGTCKTLHLFRGGNALPASSAVSGWSFSQKLMKCSEAMMIMVNIPALYPQVSNASVIAPVGAKSCSVEQLGRG